MIGKIGRKTLKIAGIARRLVENIYDAPAIVLNYHRIADLKRDTFSLSVSPDRFEAQLAALKKYCNPLHPDEFFHLKKSGGRFPRRAVIITFDDGYADNFHNALPVLSAYGLAAVFFVQTGTLGGDRELWWDSLERVFFDAAAGNNLFEVTLGGKVWNFEVRSPSGRKKAFWTLYGLLKSGRRAERDSAVDYLLRRSGLDPVARDSHRTMSMDELAAMSRSGSAVVGAHTHSHCMLSVLNEEEVRKDMSEARRILMSVCNYPPRYLSYPYGGPGEINAMVRRICREEGYEMAFLNHYWQVHKWTDIYRLPRIGIGNLSGDEFEKIIPGLFRY